MHKITEEEGNIIRVDVTGKLTRADYDELIPGWKAAIARKGKIRLLFVMTDFEGWESGAAWDDLQFDRKYGADFERVAMVGETRWQKWISKLGALFAATTVRYFDLKEMSDAVRWLHED